MKKNILLIRNAQPYDFGGGERFPVLLSSVLNGNGWHPIIVSRSQSLRNFAKELNITSIKGLWWKKQNWSGVNILLTPVYLVWQIILFVYYAQLFARLKPAIVHIQSKDDFIAATLAARCLKTKVIWTDHADLKHVWLNLTVWYKNPIGKLIHHCAQFAHTITVVSKSEQQLITAHLNEKDSIRDKITVIYNGAVDHYTERYLSKSKKTIFISVSRLVTDKGVSELIKAYKEVANQDTELWLLGEGRDRKLFESQAKSNTSIKFLGQQQNPQSYLAKSSIFVHPTHHEGFSLALVEASMMRLPIIATNVGGNPEIILDNKTGLLVPAQDSNKLAAAMQMLLDDVSLRESLGVAARRQYEAKFNFNDIVIKQFIPLYMEFK